ncbi:hypothetical protein B0H14DRAFT_2657250 [Mycena olivaceomarginata]|nr:hypothetical protein B0H14DRAFT_2657250 [Mycena olivaceomarginata]
MCGPRRKAESALPSREVVIGYYFHAATRKFAFSGCSGGIDSWAQFPMRSGLDHPNVTATKEYTSVTSAGLDSSPDSEDLNDELVNLNADHLVFDQSMDLQELQAIEIKRLTSGNVTLRKTISNMGHFTDAITQQFLDKEQKQKERIDNLMSERYALDEAVSEAKQLLEENNAALETQANELERLRTENSASRNQISNIERNPLRPHQTARADMRTRPTTWEIRPRLWEVSGSNLKLAYVHICRVQNNQVLANGLSSVSNEHFQVYRLWRDRQFGVIVVRRGKNMDEGKAEFDAATIRSVKGQAIAKAERDYLLHMTVQEETEALLLFPKTVYNLLGIILMGVMRSVHGFSLSNFDHLWPFGYLWKPRNWYPPSKSNIITNIPQTLDANTVQPLHTRLSSTFLNENVPTGRRK